MNYSRALALGFSLLVVSCTPPTHPTPVARVAGAPTVTRPPTPTVPLLALIRSSAGRWRWEYRVPGTSLLQHYWLHLSIDGTVLHAVLTYSTDTVWDTTLIGPATSAAITIDLVRGAVSSATLRGIRAVLPGKTLPVPRLAADGAHYLAMIGSDGQIYRVGYAISITGAQSALCLQVGPAYIMLHAVRSSTGFSLTRQLSLHFPAPGVPGRWVDLFLSR